MEVDQSRLHILAEPQRRGTPLPLSQLLEETRSRAKIPTHLFKSKVCAKLKSNSLIQAEPPELHFCGFELGKDYIKIVNLINISSDVMNIYIIPTQTKHFQTTYTKKHRLLPGLAYTLKVRFSPDQWCYFYDCIQVHCKGEENLLVPVHAYPVIDDLHIPSHINLPAVPLGQSLSHAIPLRCSSPVDFEFQVYVIQPHKAFSIHPLAGMIPANDEVKITVTFKPIHYETCQIVIQLVVSQFNTQPYLCTITGSSSPYLNISQLEKKLRHGEAVSAEYKGQSSTTKLPHRSKTKLRSTEQADKSKIFKDQPELQPLLDVCTHAGVAKMLIKDPNKITSKALRKAMLFASMGDVQTKQMKEVLFIKKIEQNLKEEQASHNKWLTNIGKDPMSQHARRQIAEEREIAQHEYMVKREGVRKKEDGQPNLSSTRLLFKAGQATEGAPSFQFFSSFQLELKHRPVKLFQQAARKVVIRCRMSRRLASLKNLADSMINPPSPQKVEGKITLDKVFPFSLPVFTDEDDPLAHRSFATLPVDPIDVTVTTNIPFFKINVPQRYKLMGYQPVSTWDAYNSYIPSTLARPLRTGPPLVPDETEAQSSRILEPKVVEEEQQLGRTEESVIAKLTSGLTFSIPEALLKPLPANPLRIFNPAPGLQAYKPTFKYLENDHEFHLCPLPRDTVDKKSTSHMTSSPHNQNKPLDFKEVIKGFMAWHDFDSVTLKCLSNQLAFTSDCTTRRSFDYNTGILPLTAPPPLTSLPDDMAAILDKMGEDSGLQLTTEMIRAEFLSGEALVCNTGTEMEARHLRESQMEKTDGSGFNQMGKRVIARLKQLEFSDRTSPGEDSE